MRDGPTTACDVLVAGGGLAGLTAALFAARCGRSTIALVPLAPGGTLLDVERIEDYPGFPEGIAGFELGPAVQEQAENAGAVIHAAELDGIEPAGEEWIATTADGTYRARAVVIATGTRPRPAGIDGEERLAAHGVSHCASCDGPLFRGQTVGVIGGGDSGVQEALTLATHAARVLVFEQADAIPAQDAYRIRAESHPAIELRRATTVVAILGGDAVEGVRILGSESELTTDVSLRAVFVYAGRSAESHALAELVDLDDGGRIVTDARLGTSRPGLFAAGDVRSGSSGQAIGAAGDGAAAAIAAHRYLESRDRVTTATEHAR